VMQSASSFSVSSFRPWEPRDDHAGERYRPERCRPAPRGGKNSPKACLVLRLRFDKDKRVRGGWRRSRERREKAEVLAAFAAHKDEGTEGYVASGKRG